MPLGIALKDHHVSSAPYYQNFWEITLVLKSNQPFSFVIFVGSGSLRAKFELSEGPTKPATLAVQFTNEGNTLSGIDVELVGTGYRLSLLKKRFTSGKTPMYLHIQINMLYSAKLYIMKLFNVMHK